MAAILNELLPPTPQFTEKDVPDLMGKVILVTGATSGVGKELARLLYQRNATVYLASRNAATAEDVMAELRRPSPTISTTATSGSSEASGGDGKGQLYHLAVDLSDLTSVANAAHQLLAMAPRLDVLVNNAGVMLPPAGSMTAQGHEMQMGTNALAPFLLVKLLTPLLRETARESVTVAKQAGASGYNGPVAPRVLWVSSSAAELFSPRGGVDLDNLDYTKKDVSNGVKYAASKAGMVLLSQEFARRHREHGIISVAMNPGNLKTDLRRHLSRPVATVFGWISHDPVKGAYTELFAAFSPQITLENSGCWVIPWGRLSTVRKDIHASSLPESEGGSKAGERFWDWCEAAVAPFVDPVDS